MKEVHKVKPLPFAYNALDDISEQEIEIYTEEFLSSEDIDKLEELLEKQFEEE